MPTTQERLAIVLAVLLPMIGAGAATTEPELAHRVAFELGDAEFAPGDSIVVDEVHGTQPTVAVGGTYSVSGHYTLSSAAEAELSLFVTTTDRNPTPFDRKQTMRVKKGAGTFRLTKTMTEDGYLHVSFYPASGGNAFGGVYFGQGQWVLRDKHFSYRAQPLAATAGATANTSSQSKQVDGPNKVLFEYLGEPVKPPADLDPAYTKENMLKTLFSAAEKAGISVKAAQIDASEFPFIVGISCAPADFTRLKNEINKISGYEWSGGISNERCMAVNIVPSRAFPPHAAQRIYRRLMLREAVLFDKLNR